MGSAGAEIIFDTNEPIRTPVWFNTIDNSNPTSEVQPLDGTQERAFFAVEWAGEDEGAGVRDLDVFSSEDGGPFTPWQTNTSATTAMFLGEDGRTYDFYSIARDLTRQRRGQGSAGGSCDHRGGARRR